MFILICGTSGSGKSQIAEDMLSKFDDTEKFYIATAKIYDDEMKKRVLKHQAVRKNKGFITVEAQTAPLISEKICNTSILIEALTTWLANEIFDDGKIKRNAAENIVNEIHALKKICGNIILVSDDIFSDGVIYDETTEFYIKTLAGLTIKFADEADEVIECVAGLPLRLK